MRQPKYSRGMRRILSPLNPLILEAVLKRSLRETTTSVSGKRIDHGGCGPQCDTKSAVAASGAGRGKANRSKRHET
jgi:hypothetical protein